MSMEMNDGGGTRGGSTAMRWLVAALVVANLGLLAWLWLGPSMRAGGSDREPRGDRGARAFDFIVERTGMTPEQRGRYAELRDDHQRRIRDIQGELRRHREALFDRLHIAGAADSTMAADSIAVAEARAIGDAHAAIERVTFAHFAKVRTLLDPEQQKRFDAIIQEALRMMAPPPPGGGPPGGR